MDTPSSRKIVKSLKKNISQLKEIYERKIDSQAKEICYIKKNS
jgi:hypothetical protein